MLKRWISGAKPWIEQILVVIILFMAFQFIIYPELVNITPVFAEESTGAGRGPDSPTEVALMATLFIGGFIYNFLKLVMED